ncbi:MAG: CHAD domain-containing protein [Candidatus Contendobacter sp.]|nr:CHAD domain-containing protein [Candidatus Contendobacter sp.]
MTPKPIAHVKASPITLAADATSEDAFVTIIGACLRHAEANRPAVLDGQTEGVHQMRVAFRRLRSGLKIFRPLIPREVSAALVEDIRWLNGFLGPARDWDVFVEEGMAPILAHFPRKRGLALFRTRAETIRQTHHRTLREALADPHYRQLTRALAAWLDNRAWREKLDDKRRERLAQPAVDFATSLLGRDHRRVEKQGEAFAELSAVERHRLRIRIKELRYALDFFASLYPASTVKAYLGALARLQDSLGIMNDIAVARRLLDEARLRTVAAARQVIEGWYGCRLDVQEHAFHDLWRGFMACERPWKD